MAINFGQPTESQTVAARNTSSRDHQLALAKLLEGETVSGLTASAVGIKRLNNGVLEHLTNHSPETWAEKPLAYAKSASPAFTGIPTAPTAAADTNTTQLATTAFVVGQAGGAAPVMNGTAAAGTSLRYARQDHVHPTDTSRAPLASPNFSGTPTVAGALIWHAGNDGAGSGLDADLLDGYQASSFALLTGATFTGDITTYRSGAPGTGVLYLGNSGTKYLWYDGTRYVLANAPLYLAGSFLADGTIRGNAGGLGLGKIEVTTTSGTPTGGTDGDIMFVY